MTPTAVADPAKTRKGTSGRRKNRHRAVPLEREFRKFGISKTNIEVRSKGNTNELIVEGEPIKYDTRYSVYDFFGEFQEEIRAGALTDIIDNVDPRLLLNHDGIALARNGSGTLELEDSKTALKFRATMDARMQAANDFYYAVERGDMDEMSVGMVVGHDVWEEERSADDEDEYVEVRAIDRLADLVDVSGVTYAASPTTTIDARAARLAAMMPEESRARLRRLEVSLRSGETDPKEILEALVALRSGATLSKANVAQVTQAATALEAVLKSAGIDPRELSDESVEERDEEPNEDEDDDLDLDDDDEDEDEDDEVDDRSSALRFALELRRRRR